MPNRLVERSLVTRSASLISPRMTFGNAACVAGRRTCGLHDQREYVSKLAVVVQQAEHASKLFGEHRSTAHAATSSKTYRVVGAGSW